MPSLDELFKILLMQHYLRQQTLNIDEFSDFTQEFETFFISLCRFKNVLDMDIRSGGRKGISHSRKEIGTTKQKFLDNLKRAV